MYGVSTSGQMGEQRMKEELYITFHSEDDIRHFVDTCNEFDDAIDIRIQKMAMDDEDNYEEFKQAILEKYDVKVVQATEKQAADKIV